MGMCATAGLCLPLCVNFLPLLHLGIVVLLAVQPVVQMTKTKNRVKNHQSVMHEMKGHHNGESP